MVDSVGFLLRGMREEEGRGRSVSGREEGVRMGGDVGCRG